MAILDTDNLLIDRGGTLYKAPVSALPGGGGGTTTIDGGNASSAGTIDIDGGTAST